VTLSKEHLRIIVPENTKKDNLFKDQSTSKTLPYREAHTYIAYIREYPPPPRVIAVGGQLAIQIRIVWIRRSAFDKIPYRQPKFVILEREEFISDAVRT